MMNPVEILCYTTNPQLAENLESVVSGLEGRSFRRISLCQPIEVTPDSGLLVIEAAEDDDAEINEWLSLAMSNEKAATAPFLILTPSDDSTAALKWLRRGAVDCVVPDPSRLALLLDKFTVAKWKRRQGDQARWLEENGFVYRSTAMRDLVSKIELVARSDANVLLSGETGAGKTTVARAIHFHSRRRKMPFCTVNCGAMPFSLIESELFGHRKGAFTGADENRLGRLRSVGKGTLFLDEIDTLALEAQPKLLRALDTRSFEVVGEDKHQEFMGRIISATNRPLEELAEVGEFRKDLYYRLKVVELSVPPLREHREDISPIANRFLAELANRENSPKKSFTRSAVQRLEDHSWPGNIRELRNAVEQAAVFSPNNVIDVAHFMNLTSPSRNHPTAHARSNGHRVRQASGSDEAELIKELLAKNGNNRSRTAMELGISRAAFYKKLTKYGLVSQQ